MKPVTIYTNRNGLRHDTGPGHPERPERLQVLLDLFDEKPFSDWPQIPSPAAELEWIARCHPMKYIEALQDAMPDDTLVRLDSDTVASPGTWDAALCAAGAVCRAVEDIASGKITRAFCANRPPGHHAEPTKSMGFCLFNNVFVGALHAQSLGMKKIVIIDFDVHHGNGSDAMAQLHGNVFYISSHQWPLYPGTGGPDDQIENKIMNIPLPAGTGSARFRDAYEKTVFPALNAYAPDLVMISAGFDAHRDDPLAQMELSDDDFFWITKVLCDISNLYSQGRVVSVLEGGYDLDALKNSVAAHLRALAGSAL